MFNNVFYLLAFLPLLYKYWKPILLNINNIYFYTRDRYNNYVYKTFDEVDLKKMKIDNKDIIVYTFLYKNEEYIILSEKNTFTKTPYTIDYIKKKHDNSSTSIESKDNIIIADITPIGREQEIIDCLNHIHKLCGPLGDFYKGTPVEIKSDLLKKYLENILNINIMTLQIMTSLGEEKYLVK